MKILFNAQIYTMAGQNVPASCMVIDKDRIIAVRDDNELHQELKGKATEIDIEGRVIIPGLVDAHLHLEHYALGLKKIDCETENKSECLQRVAAAAQHTPPGDWILGHGWNQNSWIDGYGTADELDRVAPENPVFLTAKSLHVAWVNHRALRLAGIFRENIDPDNGSFGRDMNGELNGILYERAASLVEKQIPAPTVDFVAEAINHAQRVLWAKGLTGVHDFDRARCFSALQLLHQRGDLRIRVLKSIPVESLQQAIDIGLRSGFGDDFLKIGGIKIFADGALGPRTAAMLQSYETEPENRGMLFMDGEELFEIGYQAANAGFSLAVHAIGDRANHEMLNGFERLREYERQISARRVLPHRIEHVQLVHPDDAPRLSTLGIVASMQPLHATSDMEMADRYWGGRSIGAYASKTQLEHGARLAFGSDAPVEDPDPFLGLHAAVSRRRIDGAPGEQGWYPEQRLTVQQALEAFTSGPAYAAGMENRLGKIAPGYLADLVVLDQNPFMCPADEIYCIRPAKTMVSGEWVYEA